MPSCQHGAESQREVFNIFLIEPWPLPLDHTGKGQSNTEYPLNVRCGPLWWLCNTSSPQVMKCVKSRFEWICVWVKSQNYLSRGFLRLISAGTGSTWGPPACSGWYSQPSRGKGQGPMLPRLHHRKKKEEVSSSIFEQKTPKRSWTCQCLLYPVSSGCTSVALTQSSTRRKVCLIHVKVKMTVRI